MWGFLPGYVNEELFSALLSLRPPEKLLLISVDMRSDLKVLPQTGRAQWEKKSWNSVRQLGQKTAQPGQKWPGPIYAVAIPSTQPQ